MQHRNAKDAGSTIDTVYCPLWVNLASLQLYRRNLSAGSTVEQSVRCDRIAPGALLIRARLRMELEGYVDLSGARNDALMADHLAAGHNSKIKRISALAFLRNDEFSSAITQAQQAIDLNDMATVNYLIIAVAKARLGDLDDARTAYDRADALWPENLKSPDGFVASAHRGILWFDTTEELLGLRREAEELVGVE